MGSMFSFEGAELDVRDREKGGGADEKDVGVTRLRRKTPRNGDAQNGQQTSQDVSSADLPKITNSSPDTSHENNSGQSEAQYRPAQTVNPQQGSGGNGSENANQTSAPKKPVRRMTEMSENKPSKPERIRGDTVQMPKVPRAVADFIIKEFPNADRREDALTAYIYIKSGQKFEVSDKVKALVEEYEGDKSIQNMEKRVQSLERMAYDMTRILQELQLGMSYVLADRKGFCKAPYTDARSVNLLEQGVLDVRERLREQTNEQKKRDDVKKGRPIR